VGGRARGRWRVASQEKDGARTRDGGQEVDDGADRAATGRGTGEWVGVGARGRWSVSGDWGAGRRESGGAPGRRGEGLTLAVPVRAGRGIRSAERIFERRAQALSCRSAPQMLIFRNADSCPVFEDRRPTS